jgi:hypothetical protein
MLTSTYHRQSSLYWEMKLTYFNCSNFLYTHTWVKFINHVLLYVPFDVAHVKRENKEENGRKIK